LGLAQNLPFDHAGGWRFSKFLEASSRSHQTLATASHALCITEEIAAKGIIPAISTHLPETSPYFVFANAKDFPMHNLQFPNCPPRRQPAHRSSRRFRETFVNRLPGSDQREATKQVSGVIRKQVTTTTRWLRDLQFPLLWSIIGAVSAIDTFLLVYYQESLPYLEKNPLGLALLNLGDSNPALMVGVKFLGSIAVLGILGVLQSRDRAKALPVAYGVAAFQSMLLGYLFFA
jgi:hypothetical protein